jgi:hypothetical protein
VAAPLLILLQDASRRGFQVTSAQVVVGLASALLVTLCVLFHYEAMSWISRRLPATRLPRRMRIVVLIYGMLAAHVVEVWFFGLAYWLLDRWPWVGTLAGAFEEGALDFVYFSVVTYTTLGFGDVVPSGAVRILTGTEALLGLALITWSASFAFLEMQRDWTEFRRPSAGGG